MSLHTYLTLIYYLNKPIGCSGSSIYIEVHYVYQIVEKKNNDLSCPGYLFKGWVIDDNDKLDMTIINDELFVMPSHDVHIKATWTKQELNKKMDGTIAEAMTLYDIFEKESNDGIYATEYAGEHRDSYIENGTKKIYHWYASNSDMASEIQNKYNVIFANHCWQMYRTTDTGGVKLIYNGEPENDKCLKNRSSHSGYEGSLSLDFNETNYYYGTDYIFDPTTRNYKLSGDIKSIEINLENASETVPEAMHLYSCRSTNPDATCSQIMYTESFYNNTHMKYLYFYGYQDYSTIGKVSFNDGNYLLEGVGYMKNAGYERTINGDLLIQKTMSIMQSVSSKVYVADSISWDPVEKKYNLVNPTYESISTASTGKYTFFKYDLQYTDSTVSYIVGKGTNNAVYYIPIKDGNDLSYYNYKITYGNSYIDNNDGTYTIKNTNGSNPVSFNLVDWDNYSTSPSYNSFSNNFKYVCINATNNTCTDLLYKNNYSRTSFSYLRVSNYFKFANGFKYVCDNNDNCKYVLNNNYMYSYNLNFDATALSNYHYTCWNKSGECETLSYVYHVNGYSPYYINLSNGEGVDDAITNMLYRDDNDYHVNKNDSTAKTAVEAWYKKYIYDKYDKYIEDTIYCNDRSINNNGPFNPNGGTIKGNSLYFRGKTSDLSCLNETDMFSTYNNKAKTSYKIGEKIE